MKRCTKCNSEYEATTAYFPKDKRLKDGLSSWCRKCDSLKGVQWQKTNTKKYNQNHLKWCSTHREQCNRISREWKKDNPNKGAVFCQRYRANKLGLPSNFTVDDWQTLLGKFDNRCAYCQCDGKLTMDHIVPVSSSNYPGHVVGNLVPACQHCNSSKGNRILEDWLEFKFPDSKTQIMERIAQILAQ